MCRVVYQTSSSHKHGCTVHITSILRLGADYLIFCDLSQKIHQNVTKNSSGTQKYDVIFAVLDIQPTQSLYIIVMAPTTSILELPLYS